MSSRKSKAEPVVSATRRGSPEAVLKRRAARHFNDLLGGGVERAGQLDGRTEKKRQRMLEELREGKVRSTGRSLKPIDILLRVDALLALGEPVATLKKASKPPRPVPVTEDVVVGVRRLHDAYGFRVEVYQFVGIAEPALTKAGVAPPVKPTGRPPPREASSDKPGVARRAPRGAARTRAA